jgi:hypothetical protein
MHRHITEALSAVGSSCLLGGGRKRRAGGPRKFLNLESLDLKRHLLDFGDVLTEFRCSEKSVLVCRNLQFAYNLVVLNGRRRI